MKGVYRFYQAGVLIGESENLITNDGKRIIMQYLAGFRANIATHIGVGLSNTAANVSDKELGFEWARSNIVSTSPDYANTLVIFKARFDPIVSGVIYETGLWSPDDLATDFGSKMLLDFDSGADVWTAGSFTTSTARVGSDSLRLAPAASATVTAQKVETSIDLSGYSNFDEFKLAYNVGNANAASVFVRFYVDATNYYTYTITSPTSGYKIQKFSKSDLVATGSPTFSGITYVGVGATATAGGSVNVDFDALRIDDKDTYTETNVLVSRAVPSTPITMLPNLPMDVEYSLDVTV